MGNVAYMGEMKMVYRIVVRGTEDPVSKL